MGTVIYFLFLFAFVTVFFPLIFLIWAVTTPFDKSSKIVHKASRILSYAVIKICPFWRVEIVGEELIDKNKTYVIVSNHQSVFDIPLISHLPLHFKWVSKKEVYKIPVFGWVLWLRRDISIDRGGLSSTKKMLKKARQCIAQKVSIIIYPEGTRSKTGRVNKFKEGAFIIAKMTNAPIVPIVIDGTWILLNDKGLFGLKMPNKFRLTVLEPIPAEDVKRMDVKELTQHCHDKIEAKYKEISGVGYETNRQKES